MQKIEITGDLDKSWIVSLLAQGMNTYEILSNYSLTEEIIAECEDLLDKDILLRGFTFSEKFIRISLSNNYFNLNDIQNFNMSTYSILSRQFIEEYQEYLNWNRFIVFISTQNHSFIDYVSIIEDKNLWNLISANDLSIDFIRKYKDRLDWNLLSIAKCFTNEEKDEFSEYIIETKREFNEDSSGLNPLTDYYDNFYDDTNGYSIDEISDMIDMLKMNE